VPCTDNLAWKPINTVGELPASDPKPSFQLDRRRPERGQQRRVQRQVRVAEHLPVRGHPVCATSVRKFNERAADTGATVVNVSKDLPFAQKRFCGAEGSRTSHGVGIPDSFGEDYGTTIADGPMPAACPSGGGHWRRRQCRLHAAGAEIAEEPDYDAALAALADFSSGRRQRKRQPIDARPSPDIRVHRR